MIPITLHPFLLPLALAVWALDSYLFALTARCLLGRIRTRSGQRLGDALRPFTDAPPQYVSQVLTARSRRNYPSWLPWLLVVVSVLLVRQALVALILLGTAAH